MTRFTTALVLSSACAAAWALQAGADWEDDASVLVAAMDVGTGSALTDPLGTCTPATPDGCLWPVGAHPFATERRAVAYDALLSPGRVVSYDVRLPTDLAPGELAPLVVLSHGGSDGFSDPGQAIPGWSNGLAQAGYAVVTIGHRARSPEQIAALCAELGFAPGECGGTLAFDRPQDIQAVMNDVIPALTGRGVDLEHVGMLGYSAGGSAALIEGGLVRQLGNHTLADRDLRFDAIVAVSQNAGGSGIEMSRYARIDRPVMMVTGAGDVTASEGPGAIPGNATVRRAAFEQMLQGGNVFLMVDDPVPNHGFYSMKLDDCAAQLGLARCREIANWARTSVVAWFDWQLRGDDVARQWLQSDDLSVASDGVAALTVSVDRDADDDFVADDVDLCSGDDATGDPDADRVCSDLDEDDDGDGLLDNVDACLGDNATGDLDGDRRCDDLDDDDDGDGFPDAVDTCPFDPDPTLADADLDGFGDACDLCLGDDQTGDFDEDGVCEDVDLCLGDDATGDSDADGTCAELDACDFDQDKVSAGACGCGVSDVDLDRDSVLDCLEERLVLDGDTSLVSFPTSGAPFATFTGQLELGGGLLAPDLRVAGAQARIGVSVGEVDVYGFGAAPQVMTVVQSGLATDNRESWEFTKSTRETGSFRWTDTQSYDSARDPGMPRAGTAANLGRVTSTFIRSDESRLRISWDGATSLPLTVTIDGIVLATVSCADAACLGYAVDTAFDKFEVYADGSTKRTWDVGFPDALGDGNVMAWYRGAAAVGAPAHTHEAIDNGSATSTYYNAGGGWSLTVPVTGATFTNRAISTIGLWVGTGGAEVSGCYTFGTGGYVVDTRNRTWRSNEVAEDAGSVSYPTGDVGFVPSTIFPDANGDHVADAPNAGRSWCRTPAGWTQ